MGKDLTRSKLCNSITKVIQASDGSSQLLESTFLSLIISVDSSEIIRESSLLECQNALSQALSLVSQGFLQKSSQSLPLLLVDALSKFADFFYDFPGPLKALLKSNVMLNQLQVIADGLLGTLTSGEESLNITSNNLLITLTKQVALGNVKLSIPLSPMESTYGKGLFTSIEFSDEVVKNLDSGSGYLPLMFMKFIKNPYYLTSYKLRSAVYLLHSSSVYLSDIKISSTVVYYVVIQFSETQDFNFGINIDQVITNFTFPELTIMNDNSSTPWKGCKVSSYNNYNVSFACDSLTSSVITTNSHSIQALALKSSHENIKFGASITTPDPIDLSDKSADFVVNVEYVKVASLFLISLFALIIIGYTSFYRWDLIDSRAVKKTLNLSSIHRKSVNNVSSDISKRKSLLMCNFWNPPMIISGNMKSQIFLQDFYDDTGDANLLQINNPLHRENNSLYRDIVNRGVDNHANIKMDETFLEQDTLSYDVIYNSTPSDQDDTLMIDQESRSSNQHSESKLNEFQTDLFSAFSKLTASESITLSSDINLRSKYVRGNLPNQYFEPLSEFLDSPIFYEEASFILRTQKLILTVLRQHEYLNMFYHPSLRNTRTIRWTRVVLRVIIFLFITTVFYGVFYSDDGSCQSHKTEHTCLSEINVLFNGHQCTWTIDSSYSNTRTIESNCALNVPTTSIIYIMIVLALTIVVSIPVIVFYHSILTLYCMHNPYFQLNSATLSSETETVRDIFYEVNPMDSTAHCKDLQSDLFSPEQEAEYLLHKVRSTLIEYADLNSDLRNSKREKIEAALQWIGINIDGSHTPISFIDWFRYRTPHAMLVAKIKSVRYRAAMIKTVLENDCKTEKSKQDMLMQFFILEQFTSMKQYVLNRQMFTFPLINPSLISPVSWTCAWLVIVLSIAFFFYWILNWVLSQGGATFWLWILNFGICLSLDIFIVQSIYAYAIFVLLMKSIISQLKKIHEILSNIAISCKQGSIESSTKRDTFKMMQFSSPVYRVLTNKAAFPNLKVLINLDDDDVMRCKENHSFRIGMISWFALFLPLVIGIVNQFAGDAVLELILSVFFPSLVIGSYYLYTEIGMLVAFPFASIVVYLIWRNTLDKYSRTFVRSYDIHESLWSESRRHLSAFLSFKDRLLFFIYYATRPIKLLKWLYKYFTATDESWIAMNYPNKQLTSGSSTSSMYIPNEIEKLRSGNGLHNSYLDESDSDGYLSDESSYIHSILTRSDRGEAQTEEAKMGVSQHSIVIEDNLGRIENKSKSSFKTAFDTEVILNVDTVALKNNKWSHSQSKEETKFSDHLHLSSFELKQNKLCDDNHHRIQVISNHSDYKSNLSNTDTLSTSNHGIYVDVVHESQHSEDISDNNIPTHVVIVVESNIVVCDDDVNKSNDTSSIQSTDNADLLGAFNIPHELGIQYSNYSNVEVNDDFRDAGVVHGSSDSSDWENFEVIYESQHPFFVDNSFKSNDSNDLDMKQHDDSSNILLVDNHGKNSNDSYDDNGINADVRHDFSKDLNEFYHIERGSVNVYNTVDTNTAGGNFLMVEIANNNYNTSDLYQSKVVNYIESYHSKSVKESNSTEEKESDLKVMKEMDSNQSKTIQETDSNGIHQSPIADSNVTITRDVKVMNSKIGYGPRYRYPSYVRSIDSRITSDDNMSLSSSITIEHDEYSLSRYIEHLNITQSATLILSEIDIADDHTTHRGSPVLRVDRNISTPSTAAAAIAAVGDGTTDVLIADPDDFWNDDIELYDEQEESSEESELDLNDIDYFNNAQELSAMYHRYSPAKFSYTNNNFASSSSDNNDTANNYINIRQNSSTDEGLVAEESTGVNTNVDNNIITPTVLDHSEELFPSSVQINSPMVLPSSGELLQMSEGIKQDQQQNQLVVVEANENEHHTLNKRSVTNRKLDALLANALNSDIDLSSNSNNSSDNKKDRKKKSKYINKTFSRRLKALLTPTSNVNVHTADGGDESVRQMDDIIVNYDDHVEIKDSFVFEALNNDDNDFGLRQPIIPIRNRSKNVNTIVLSIDDIPDVQFEKSNPLTLRSDKLLSSVNDFNASTLTTNNEKLKKHVAFHKDTFTFNQNQNMEKLKQIEHNTELINSSTPSKSPFNNVPSTLTVNSTRFNSQQSAFTSPSKHSLLKKIPTDNNSIEKKAYLKSTSIVNTSKYLEQYKAHTIKSSHSSKDNEKYNQLITAREKYLKSINKEPQAMNSTMKSTSLNKDIRIESGTLDQKGNSLKVLPSSDLKAQTNSVSLASKSLSKKSAVVPVSSNINNKYKPNSLSSSPLNQNNNNSNSFYVLKPASISKINNSKSDNKRQTPMILSPKSGDHIVIQNHDAFRSISSVTPLKDSIKRSKITSTSNMSNKYDTRELLLLQSTTKVNSVRRNDSQPSSSSANRNALITALQARDNDVLSRNSQSQNQPNIIKGKKSLTPSNNTKQVHVQSAVRKTKSPVVNKEASFKIDDNLIASSKVAKSGRGKSISPILMKGSSDSSNGSAEKNSSDGSNSNGSYNEGHRSRSTSPNKTSSIVNNNNINNSYNNTTTQSTDKSPKESSRNEQVSRSSSKTSPTRHPTDVSPVRKNVLTAKIKNDHDNSEIKSIKSQSIRHLSSHFKSVVDINDDNISLHDLADSKIHKFYTSSNDQGSKSTNIIVSPSNPIADFESDKLLISSVEQSNQMVQQLLGNDVTMQSKSPQKTKIARVDKYSARLNNLLGNITKSTQSNK
jgi:hypothetical protein